MRTTALAILAAAVLMGLAAPAAAGGSVWGTDRPWYRPGQAAELVGIVAWAHNPALGRPEDGPYVVHLVPEADDCYGCVPDGGLPLGELTIDLEPWQAPNGEWYGPFHAWLRFTVPYVPEGRYAITHCNVPCTKPLGDMTWGRLLVAGPRWHNRPV